MSATWQERLWSKAQTNAAGCWIWQGRVDPDGYGTFKLNRATRAAHRCAYVAAHGEIPSGLEIDHLCNVRPCVNPDHLEAVTRTENNRRRIERNTHCRNGHEWTPENTALSATWPRRCRTCQHESRARRRAA